MTAEQWLVLAGEVGSFVAPAGLNYSTSGTTEWIYAAGDFALAPPWVAHPVGVRVEVEDALQVDALWRPRLRRERLPTFELSAHDEYRLAQMARKDREMFMRTAAVLDGIQLSPGYPYPYVYDMLENGLTIMRIDRRR